MKVILVSKNNDRVRQISLGNWWARTFLSMCVLGLPLGVGVYLGTQLPESGTKSDQVLPTSTIEQWSSTIEEQKEQMEAVKKASDDELNAVTLRLAELQARLVRLDALGERLTNIADLDGGEFDFGQSPAIGGPETAALGEAYQAPHFADVVDQLFDTISDREQQLDILEALMSNRQLQDDILVAGRPVKKGWISSRFGRRTDPFNGSVSWHAGVDFAGKYGTDIISVAAGVVVESTEKSGYGGTVVVNHGNGFKTLYAHNKENLVNVGDVVKKGQVIALMGSSGRATGPHVHFEVFKHGRKVDPATYIQRSPR